MGEHQGLTRRETLRRAGAAGLGLTALGGGLEALLAGEAAAAPAQGSLKDIEHVIFFMQENRSFDHYFGTLSGVRGFGDKSNAQAFKQKSTSGKTVEPFRLPAGGIAYCMPDITHDWAPQHAAWNHGKNNQFVRVHDQAEGPAIGIETIGYYKRADLRFYYSLADAFTICDGYHCSVIGPTDPNRIMSMSATLDPAGHKGGPLLETLNPGPSRDALKGAFKWTTMPERLSARGIDWKIYTQGGGGVLDNALTYFAPYNKPGDLANRAFNPTFPDDFMSDLKYDRLPKVSWLLTGLLETEHPGFSAALSGEIVAAQIIQALISNPKVWRKTALFITWDENGGFFDHVPPPVAPKGTPGEYVTVSPLPAAAGGIHGPIGLGFRVPMLVVSPFSRGGLVCSDVFDHTSMLRFLETRFGVEVPNLSKWRRGVTGDLTSALNFAAKPNAGRPSLSIPGAASALVCASPKPVTVSNMGIPKQEKGTRKRPSGIVKSKKGAKPKKSGKSKTSGRG
jgi:phospholipase C